MILILFSLSHLCMTYFEHLGLNHFYCTWLGCIRSYMKDPCYGFHISWWVVHNWFMNLGNLLEVIVHCFLIGGVNCLGHQDEVLMVSVLVCMAIHWTRHMISHDISYRVVMTSLSYYVAEVLNPERILT